MTRLRHIFLAIFALWLGSFTLPVLAENTSFCQSLDARPAHESAHPQTQII